MTIKDYVILICLIIISIFTYLHFDLLKEDILLKEEILKSKGRVEILEGQLLDNLDRSVEMELEIKRLNISLADEISKRDTIKSKYNDKVKNIIDSPIGFNIDFLSRRLSETNLD